MADNLGAYKYSWTLFWNSVKLGNSLIHAMLASKLSEWVKSRLPLRLILSHYWSNTLLNILPPALWMTWFPTMAGRNTNYVRLGDCFLCSFQMVLSPALGGVFSYMSWSVVFCWRLRGHPLQTSGLLALCSSLLLVLCSVNPGHLSLYRLLEAPSPQLGKTTSLDL